MFDLVNFTDKEAKLLNPQVLAFVGDGVYSLFIRHKIISTNDITGQKLHAEVVNFVKAKGQSNFIDKLLPLFNEDELAVFKRARNHKTLSQAKNANIIDYKRATGLEAVIGYLYLTNKLDRLNELLSYSVGEDNEN